MSSLLDSFTDDELLEELVRRRNSAKLAGIPAKYCDDCLHFKTWEGSGDVPDSYNPCSKGHAMEFFTPSNWMSPDEFGHYRIICSERQECHQ